MRAIKLAKTLGVGSFSGLQAAVGSQLANVALGGAGSSGGYFNSSASSGFSNQAFQHTKVML
jgi:hypothetical protein